MRRIKNSVVRLTTLQTGTVQLRKNSCLSIKSRFSSIANQQRRTLDCNGELGNTNVLQGIDLLQIVQHMSHHHMATPRMNG